MKVLRIGQSTQLIGAEVVRAAFSATPGLGRLSVDSWKHDVACGETMESYFTWAFVNSVVAAHPETGNSAEKRLSFGGHTSGILGLAAVQEIAELIEERGIHGRVPDLMCDVRGWRGPLQVLSDEHAHIRIHSAVAPAHVHLLLQEPRTLVRMYEEGLHREESVLVVFNDELGVLWRFTAPGLTAEEESERHALEKRVAYLAKNFPACTFARVTPSSGADQIWAFLPARLFRYQASAANIKKLESACKATT